MMSRKQSKYLLSLIVIILLVFTAFVSAEEGDAGTESNFKLGFGARALSLGNAFTALADDPTAVFWNPAGLEYIYRQCATVFHTSLWEGTIYDFIGYAYPTLELGTFGIGIGRIGVGDIQQTDASGAVYDNTFSNEEMQVYLAYSKKMPLNITPGFTIRFVRRAWIGLQEIGDLEDTGFGADIGIMYRPDWFGSLWLQDWSFGLKVHNLYAPQLKEGTIIDKLPLTIKLGLLKKIRFVGGAYFNLMADLDYSENRPMKINMGSEYRFPDIGELRVGLNPNGLTFGAGVEYNILKIDYAYGYSSNSDFFPGVHRISLSVNFGLNRDQMLKEFETKRLEEDRLIIESALKTERQNFIAKHLKNANYYYDSKQYMDAIVEYRQVLTRDSTNNLAATRIDSANYYLQERFNLMQTRAINEALNKNQAERDQEFINQHFERGRQYLADNKFNDALLEFNIALERDSTNSTLIKAIQTTKRAISEEATRLIEASREELKNQNYSDAQLLLSQAQILSENDNDKLLEINSLVEQITLQKNIQKGILLYQISEFNEALKIFESVLKEDPGNTIALTYYDKCKLETFGKDIKMDAEIKKQYLEGMDQYLLGNYSKAVEIWERILIKQPYNKKVLSAIMGAKERMKHISK